MRHREKKITKLIPNMIVKFVFDYPGEVNQYPFQDGEMLLYLGEIENMRGHCIVVNRKGKVFWGFHTENFVIPTEDEI